MNSPEHDPRRERRSPRQIQEDVDEELRFHLEQRAAELEAGGMTPAAARDEAARRFGDWNSTRRECASSDRRWEDSMRRRAYFEDLRQDLLHGLRQLRARPRFALPAILTLAVGIGSATAILGAADHVLVRPLPYREPARVLTLWERDRAAGDTRRQVSPGNLLEWRARTRSFVAMGVAEPSGVDLTETTPPLPLRTWDVSEGFLEALAVTPAAGRLFRAEDYRDAQRVVMISHDLWRRRFGAAPDVAGRTISIDDHSHTIVGVLPAGMEYPEKKDVWRPKAFRPHELEDRRSSYMDAVARLAPGVTPAAARADLERVARQLAAEYPRTNATVTVEAVPIAEHLLGRVRTALLILMGAVTLMLLIACANVAGLMIARGVEREREFAIRMSLGADRERLARQLMTESLLLSGLGGIAGVALAWWGTRLLVARSPEWLPRASTLGVDARVLAIALAVTVAAAVLFGLLPALRFSLARAGQLGLGTRSTPGRRGIFARRAIVVGQLAAALVLLSGAGLLMRSFDRVLANDLGFETKGRASMQVFLWDRNPTAAARLQRTQEIVDGFRSIPGVEGVGLVSALPFHPSQIDAQGELEVQGRAPRPEGDPQAYTTVASPEYFAVMGIPRLAGRVFDRRDRADAPRVAVVSRTLARRIFPGEDPVGKRVRFGVMSAPEVREIVGVVGDVRPTAYDSDPRPEIYVPHAQSATGSVTFVARTSGDAGHLLAAMRQRMTAIDSRQTVYLAATAQDLIDRTLVERRFYLTLMAAFSLVALILAGTGVYGLMSMSTGQRAHEIGIRMALGARPSDLVSMVLGEGARVMALGVVLGVFGSLWFARALGSMYERTGALEPATLAAVGLVLAVVALVAALVPALRSARVDPMTVLRSE